MEHCRGNLPAETRNLQNLRVLLQRGERFSRYWQDELGSSNPLMHIIESVLTDRPDNIFISFWDMFWCGNLSVCSVSAAFSLHCCAPIGDLATSNYLLTV
jgi:hypothetical protein